MWRQDQKIGILQRTTHFLVPQSLSPIYKAQVWWNTLLLQGALKNTKHCSIQDIAAQAPHPKPLTPLLMHRCSSVYHLHLPNPHPLLARRASAPKIWEHHQLGVLFKSHTILTWKHIVAALLSQIPEIPYSTLTFQGCNSSRGQLTMPFARAIRMDY